MERAVEEYSLDEPADAPHGIEASAGTLSDPVGPRRFQQADSGVICANPLREEPHPAAVRAVQRFGIVGLVACAVGTGLLRWWRSTTH